MSSQAPKVAVTSTVLLRASDWNSGPASAGPRVGRLPKVMTSQTRLGRSRDGNLVAV
ncbi:hypothetical protein JS278_02893 [Acidipropionibacterium virtanenii]|uniref:Uncharacterized protein n=1 Tax=Acidipropionibacterium virtanenii TaxID=2057246 RepID=A0A344UXM9_9ACTN|nr:hypothetical protein JS278_02893 [Acidipropionibacterium virtanenii]